MSHDELPEPTKQPKSEEEVFILCLTLKKKKKICSCSVVFKTSIKLLLKSLRF